MLKKFAMLATMAALFVACGTSTEAEMESNAADMEAEAQESMNGLEADMNAAGDAATETVVEGAEAVEGAADQAVEGVENTTEKVEESMTK